jgi:ABC-2 type transport system ATP-binding protein
LSRLLEERGIPFQLLRNGFTIRHVEPLEIGTLAAGAGIALSHLQSKGASLEDIFLELVSGVRTHASAAGPVAAAPAEPETVDAEAPAPAPEPAPSTDLVPVLAAPRRAAAPVEPDPEPRSSYAVASTGVIDIVPIDDARAADTEVPR